MMGKKRGEGGPGLEDGGSHQLHQPAPLHQQQLQVRVGDDNKMAKKLDESGDVKHKSLHNLTYKIV